MVDREIKMIQVNFKLEIPLGQGNLRSLDYSLDVEFFGSKEEAESYRGTHSENLDRLKRGGFNRNLLPYERWDIIFRGVYRMEQGLEELALDLLQNKEWYSVDMRACRNERIRKLEYWFLMPDGTMCPFDAVLGKESTLNFSKLTQENPDLFRFIYGHSIEEIRKFVQKNQRKTERIVAYGGPFSEFLGGKTTTFYFPFQMNQWLHGMSDAPHGDRFHIGEESKALSRGVRYVKK